MACDGQPHKQNKFQRLLTAQLTLAFSSSPECMHRTASAGRVYHGVHQGVSTVTKHPAPAATTDRFCEGKRDQA